MGGRDNILAPMTDFHMFVPKMGGWHEKWSAFLKWVFHHYYGQTTEVGSLAYACLVLKRKHVDVNAKIFFKARELAKHNFMGHVFGYFMYYMQNNGAPNFDGYGSAIEDAEPWTLESLHDLAEKFVLELNNEGPASRPTAHNACPGIATEQDALRTTSMLYLRMSYQENAVSNHNGYAYIRSLRLSVPYLIGSGATKYASEVTRLLILIFGDLSKQDAFIFTHDNFFNRDGKPGHWTEVDLAEEHQILDLKSRNINKSGASFETMRREAALTEFRHHAMAGIKKSVAAARVSNKKTVPKSDDDCLYLALLFIDGKIYHETDSNKLRAPRRKCESIGKKKLNDFSFMKGQLALCAPPIYSLAQLQQSVRNSYVNRDADEDAAAAEAERVHDQEMGAVDDDLDSVTSARSSHNGSERSSVADPHALDADDLFDEDDWEDHFLDDVSDRDEDDGEGEEE
jgi:hypothetical protein